MILHSFLYHTKNAQKSAYIWNTCAAMLNSFQSVLILIIISRIDPINDAGIFTIAFAIGNLMLTIGQYGIRQFQVSDINEKYSFKEYVLSRCITTSLMILVSILYTGYYYGTGIYSLEKGIIVLLICLAKSIDSFEDVLHGMMQQRERFDIAAKAMTLRLAGYIFVYIFTYIFTSNLILTSFAAFLFSLLICICLNRTALKFFPNKSSTAKISHIKDIFLECFPLFIAAYLIIYIGNAPKYSIDIVLSSQEQARFNYIFMPVFVIGLLSRFIYQPLISKMAVLWHNVDLKTFSNMILKQSLIMLFLVLFVMAGGFILGIPVLSVVYGVELSGLLPELMVLLIGGGFLAYTSFFQMILTVARKQTWLIIGYSTAYLLFFFFGKKVVKAYGIMGISIFYAVTVAAVALLFGIMIFIIIRQKKQKTA